MERIDRSVRGVCRSSPTCANRPRADLRVPRLIHHASEVKHLHLLEAKRLRLLLTARKERDRRRAAVIFEGLRRRRSEQIDKAQWHEYNECSCSYTCAGTKPSQHELQAV